MQLSLYETLKCSEKEKVPVHLILSGPSLIIFFPRPHPFPQSVFCVSCRTLTQPSPFTWCFRKKKEKQKQRSWIFCLFVCSCHHHHPKTDLRWHQPPCVPLEAHPVLRLPVIKSCRLHVILVSKSTMPSANPPRNLGSNLTRP